ANLKTRGSGDASFELTFDDPAGNNYKVGGKARPGNEPALDLTLAAPSLSFNRLAGMLKLKNPLLPDLGKGNLQLTAGLHRGRVSVGGRLDFSHLQLPLVKSAPPLNGSLT